MKYSAIIAMLPRLLNAEAAADYVCGETYLRKLNVQPVERLKGLTIYDRLDLDKAIEARKLQMTKADEKAAREALRA